MINYGIKNLDKLEVVEVKEEEEQKVALASLTPLAFTSYIITSINPPKPNQIATQIASFLSNLDSSLVEGLEFGSTARAALSSL